MESVLHILTTAQFYCMYSGIYLSLGVLIFLPANESNYKASYADLSVLIQTHF